MSSNLHKRFGLWSGLVLSFILLTVVLKALAFANDSQGLALRQMYDQMDAQGGNWYMNYNNETATLGWGQSYVLDSLLIMYQVTKDNRYLNKFIIQTNNVLKQRDSVRGIKDYRGLSLPGWSVSIYSINNLRYHWAGHTGMIVYPMAKFAGLVNKNPNLKAYQPTAAIFLKAAKDALAIHNDEWVEKGTTGYYIARKGAPISFDGVGIAHNLNLAITRANLAVYQASGERVYYDRASKYALLFKSDLILEPATNAYLWNYAWGDFYQGWSDTSNLSKNTPHSEGFRRYEDVGHATIDLLAVYDLYLADVVFTKEDIRRFGNTIEQKILHPDGTIANLVDGTGKYEPYVMALTLEYHQYVPTLYNFAYPAIVKAPRDGQVLFGLALLNKAYYEQRNGILPTF